jgi:flagellar hook protein FlgE
VVQAASTAAYEVSLSDQAKGLPPRDPDLVQALVNMDMAKYRAAASVKVARTADEVMGTLLSIKK